jgi:hypothetical protein
MVLMVLVFTVLYGVVTGQRGFLYRDTILVPEQKNGATVYAGDLEGVPAAFTVTADGAVTFAYAEKTYGPYTIREDPTAVSRERQGYPGIRGLEVYCAGERIFRGCVWKTDDFVWLENEDGDMELADAVVVSGDGIVTDENGNVIDPMEPSIITVLELAEGPALKHKGYWGVWLLSVVLCVANVLTMLFAEELWHFEIAFLVRNHRAAEPTDWEYTRRYISWTLLAVCALVLFIVGLQ